MITAPRRSGTAQGNGGHMAQARRGSVRASETYAGLDSAVLTAKEKDVA